MLSDPDGGRCIAITLFDTEEDRRVGDAALQAMDAPGAAMGRRVAVENYELAVEFRQ